MHRCAAAGAGCVAAVRACCSNFSVFDSRGAFEPAYCARYYARCHARFGGVRARYPQATEIGLDLDFTHPPLLVYYGQVYAELALGNFIHPPAVMFRREVLAVAGWFDPTSHRVCDWEWFVRVARHHAIAHIDRDLLRYCRSPTQMSTNPRTLLEALQVTRGIYKRDRALRLLITSLFLYGTASALSLRALVKIVLPERVLGSLRRLRSH
uniref:Putative Glycosyl transferase, family 2 n=1 Tax=mine drainage metagenome TaxID=410659 RepID=E6PV28_9ZZZZ